MAGGDLAGLVQLMREDAVSWSDGGGKASAAINPIRGADRIARFFIGLHNKSPEGLDRHIADAGGVPSLWVLDGNRVVTLITLDFDDSGRIASIFIIRNPDKLPSFPI